MADLIEIRARLDHEKAALTELREAYLALIEGGVKSYTINDKTLTRLDLDTIRKEIETSQRKIDEYTAILNGGKPRRAFGIVPQNW